MRVWIDQDLCTGDGLCTDHCPDIFVLLEDGISYVRDVDSGRVVHDPGGRASIVSVPHRFESVAIDAAEACPGECIFLEPDEMISDPPGDTTIDDTSDDTVDAVTAHVTAERAH